MSIHRITTLGAALLLSLPPAALAQPPTLPTRTLSLQGQFGHDDDRAVFNFQIAAADHFSARTLSYGGGIDAQGRSIAAGGFAPVLSLFLDGFGLLQLAVGSQATCGTVGSFCWDATLDVDLGPGRYTLVLTQDGNLPRGQIPADGFSQDGRPDFTGQDYLGQPGLRFIDINGQPRDGHWALELNTAAVPEPSTAALMAAALLLGLACRRRPDL
jgi:hypothetical protein